MSTFRIYQGIKINSEILWKALAAQNRVVYAEHNVAQQKYDIGEIKF